MRDDHNTAVLNTYRYLRLATLAVVVMLAVSIGAQRLAAGCWQTSISAYYFTGAHSIFVASLCAIGACLIVYQGNTDTEDVVLNFSGFLAFIVAMVPTTREAICAGPALPAAYDVSPGVRNNVLAVIVAGVVSEIARVIISRNADRLPPSLWARRATLIGWALLAVGALGFFAFPDNFTAKGHTVAAVSMFVGIIAVILLNALSAQAHDRSRNYGPAYRVIAAVMALALAVVIVIRLVIPGWLHIVIWVEVVLIAAFAAFWIAQTAELWEVADRRELAPTSRDLPDPTGR
ncbi:MAG: hypothetical protein WAR57_07300 [Candidatus Phosphoribacter sp.]|nr:hypothetical protein [Actinomycetales bacterium]